MNKPLGPAVLPVVTPLSGACKGVLLAWLNCLVIALCLAISERDPSVLVMVSVFAAVPAGITGLVAGSLVGAMPKHPLWWRLIVLLVPSFALVVVLGTQMGMAHYVVVASIPTLVACVVLEKWTRSPEQQEIPVARVSS